MPSQGLQQIQRLSLQQTLSPQMQQSLQILQAPAMELRALLHKEMQENPVLEETPDEVENQEATKTDPEELEDEAENSHDETADKDLEILTQLDQEWRDYFALTAAPFRRSPEEEEKRRLFLESISRVETLQEHLIAQLHLLELDGAQLALCETIIGNLDERGYLIASPEEMLSWTHPPTPPHPTHQPNPTQPTHPTQGGSASNPGSASHSQSGSANSQNGSFLNGAEGRVETALQIVQSFDPIGVGARDLRECLQLQLRRLGHKEDSSAWQIVSHHLDDLGQKRYAEIAQALGGSLEDVYRAATLIGTLDPRPGSRFTTDESRYITADLLVQKVDDHWMVLINDDWLPHLRISNIYKDILGQSGQGQEVKSYVRERIRAGKFLIRSIHQRQSTIQRIAEEIVRVQTGFLEQGRGFLKPLTMAEVAKSVGVHETTVSRGIANKHMQTPHGVFELKYFFTPGIRTSDGQSITQEKVKQAILDLVSHETPDKPLSDQEIVKMLTARAIPIARRTVAKYREELQVLPSHQRRSKPA